MNLEEKIVNWNLKFVGLVGCHGDEIFSMVFPGNQRQLINQG